jgi:hypothetical protein
VVGKLWQPTVKRMRDGRETRLVSLHRAEEKNIKRAACVGRRLEG